MHKFFKFFNLTLLITILSLYSPVTVYPVNTLFFDDFESYSENSYPSSFYIIYDGTGASNQKVISAAGPNGNATKVFRLEGAPSWSSEHGRDLPTNLPNILVIDAYIKPVAGVFPGAIGLRNPTGTWGTWISGVVFYNGKIEAIIDDFHNRTEIGTYELNNWYRVSFEHNLVQKTYNVYINKIKVANNLPMHLTLNATHLDISAQNIGTNEIYYDNVGIYDSLPFQLHALKVLQPNGSQKWNAGSRYVIRWEAPLNSYKFTLRYSTDNKATWTNIATVLASNRCTSNGTKYTCTYGWTIPAQDGRKPQSFVRVVAMDSANQVIGTDDSDKAFAIEVLRLTSPNGGEVLKAGSTHTITWQTYALTMTVARVQLQYSTNNGQTWTNIATLTENTGQYNWTVPNVSSTSCRVRVILRDSVGTIIASDISDRVFTIGQ